MREGYLRYGFIQSGHGATRALSLFRKWMRAAPPQQASEGRRKALARMLVSQWM